MIAALVVLAAWQTLVLLILIAGAHTGVVTVRFARPARRDHAKAAKTG